MSEGGLGWGLVLRGWETPGLFKLQIAWRPSCGFLVFVAGLGVGQIDHRVARWFPLVSILDMPRVADCNYYSLGLL